MTIYTRGGYAKPGTSLAFKTGSWRIQKPVHQHRAAPCFNACPAGEDPQQYLALVAQGKAKDAWQSLVMANPLPAITGRICPHFCEQGCNRHFYDDAIAIHNVERWLGDEAINNHWVYPLSNQNQQMRVAVVGAGPAGLACSYHLFQKGYQVTLFEALPEAGGLLLSAIPAYRLPRTILKQEIERLLAIGIDFKAHTVLGRDVSLDELKTDYAAVFLAPGQQKPSAWSIDGAIPMDLHQGLDLLKEWNTLGSLPQWSSVAVIGAGNTAVDTARTLKYAGVGDVHLISHKAIPAANVLPEDTMPAIPREIKHALEEGVTIHEHRGVHRLILRGERVVGVELVHMKKLPQQNGHLARVAFAGTETVLDVDQVIPAIGQSLDSRGMESLLGRQQQFVLDDWGHLCDHQHFYLGGDASGRAGTVTAAVGQGRRAAIAIDCALQERELPIENHQVVTFEQLNLNYYEPAARAEEILLEPAQRTSEDEIEQGLNAAQILAEAERCFSCGNCLACDNCWTLCPDSAVLKTKDQASDGSHYVFDYDYCKGCGLCANECPCGYIDMMESW